MIRKEKDHKKLVRIYAKAQNHARFPHLMLETLKLVLRQCGEGIFFNIMLNAFLITAFTYSKI